jgi:hypothetical protein
MAGIRCFLLLFLIGTATYPVLAQQKQEVFNQDWEKLKQEVPDWFQDAKFGIYFHWGVYAVPAYNSEWYSRGMYQLGSKSNKYHVANYGDPEKFGYKDFIPLFKAEKFNADEWVDLFVRPVCRACSRACRWLFDVGQQGKSLECQSHGTPARHCPGDGESRPEA